MGTTTKLETLDEARVFSGYTAGPETTSSMGIVVVQEIFGVNAGMRAMVDDWAAQGFVALAPDLFWRLEPHIELDPDVPEEFQQALALMSRFDADAGVADIEAAIKALRAQGCAKVGVVGYCLGGYLAYLSATRTDSDATVGYYGVNIDTKLKEANAIGKPLMLHIATHDGFVPPEKAALVRDGLATNRHVTLYDYDADHAFARAEGSSRVPALAEQADARTPSVLPGASGMSSRVIRLTAIGGPEVLELHDIDVGEPGFGEVRLRQTAIGLNYIDTYHRSGLYPVTLPSGIGLEAAGVVEAIGSGVLDFAVGDRVAYCLGPIGAYATMRLIAADRVVRIPGLVSDEVAAAVLLKGCTAEFLVERCAKVEAGQTVLVQAAAGGVGQILAQWLRHVGARVIGTAGSEAKAAIAREAGCDEVILYERDDVATAVRELTEGLGVDVVFDGVGKATWEGSLDSLKRRGLQISYGNASGAVGPIDLAILARKGSLFATRPTLFDYYASRDDILTGCGRVLDLVADGTITVDIGQRYALEDAAQAHRDLEARKTTGSTILIP